MACPPTMTPALSTKRRPGGEYQSMSAGPLGETVTKQLVYPQVSATLIVVTAVADLEANLKVKTPFTPDKSTLTYSKNQFVKAATGHMEQWLSRELGNLYMRHHQTVTLAV